MAETGPPQPILHEAANAPPTTVPWNRILMTQHTLPVPPPQVRRAPHRSTWIVIPAYNEARRLPATLGSVCPRFTNVVVVDDGSSDETADAARRAGAHVVRHLINRGQGAALQTGIEFALGHGADVVITF